jgi:tripartite-type tricarboxylate transporter receptor subunit TctC
MRRRQLLQLVSCLPGATLAAAADQTKYPNKPVRVIVPFAVGGNTDVIGRFFAQRLTDALGQTFFVENKTGSGVVVGTDLVAKSEPDGYTLLVGTSAHAVNASLFKTLPYDPVKDLKPVALVAQVPMVLSVHPSFAAKDAQEFVALLRRNPGKYSFGSSGNGGSLHMAAELLKFQEGVSAVHIPYRGAGPAMQDVLSGQVHFIIDPVSTSLPHIKSGRLRPLAVTTATRSALLPNVRTMKEQGFTRYETSTWNMFFVPAKTPDDIVGRLSAVLRQTVQDLQTAKRLTELGVEPVDSTPQSAAVYLEKERLQWASVIKAAGIQPD